MRLRIEGQAKRGVLSRYLVTNALRRQPLSRADLARQLALSPAAITAIVDGLLQHGVIREAGFAPSEKGRRPVLLHLRENAGFAIGIDIMGGASLRAALMDLSCSPVARFDLALDATSPEAVIAAIATCHHELLERSGVAEADVLGVGIASPGPVDYATGMVRRSVFLGWHDVPLSLMVSERLGKPTFTDLDVNLAAMGEYWYGDLAARVDDMVFVTVGPGIASALLLDGEVVRRRRTSIGELGHTVVVAGGLPCACGSRGCLETVASEKAMLRYAGEEMGRPMTTADVYAAALAGRPDATRVIERLGYYVGLATSNLVNLLAPSLLCIGGPISPVMSLLLPHVIETVRATALAEVAQHCTVVGSRLGEDAVLVGAGALVIEEAFKVPTHAGRPALTVGSH